jgi:RNase P/RNase MRP subunit p29
MKRIAHCLLIVLISLALTTLNGCSSGAPVTNVLAKRGSEVTLVRQTISVEPRRVVAETQNTLNQLKLQNIKTTQTALDAVFEFTSARGRSYRLLVTGTGLNTTRIEIVGLKANVDSEQANLIYAEIERNLFVKP